MPAKLSVHTEQGLTGKFRMRPVDDVSKALRRFALECEVVIVITGADFFKDCYRTWRAALADDLELAYCIAVRDRRAA